MSEYSNEWITPPGPLSIMRRIHGQITHDLASSYIANKVVDADHFWSANNPHPPHVPAEIYCPSSVIWCNPPGPHKETVRFWMLWREYVHKGASGGFLIFNVDHWRHLATPTVICTALILHRRVGYLDPDDVLNSGRLTEHATGNFPSALILSGDHASDVRTHQFLSNSGQVLTWHPSRWASL